MNTNKHMRIAGALQIVQSFTWIPFAILYIVHYILEIQEGSQALDGRMLILASALFVEICALWFGISLVMHKRWTTRVFGFICCAPSLIAFPFIIGIYTLWVLIMVNRKENVQSPQLETQRINPVNAEEKS